MTTRVERAKELLLADDLELAQIALVCGFFDKSHLTRIFAQCEGLSPGKWENVRGAKLVAV